jgi:hypothetical protein
MSKFLVLALIASLTLLTVTGCVRAPLVGGVYTDVQDGITATYSQRPAKKGEACASSILGIYASGDASINTARTNGNINAVSSVDYHSTTILGVYSTYCIIVRGN